MKLYILLTLLSINNLSCSHESPPKITQKKYYVHGDPLNIIKNTKLTAASFITTENFQSFNNYELQTVLAFVEKRKNRKTNSAKLNLLVNDGNEFNAGQAPPVFDQTKISRAAFTFVENPNNMSIVYTPAGSLLTHYKNFIFTKKDNTYQLTSIGFKNMATQVKAKVHHYSYNKQKGFSILVSFTTTEGKSLVAFYFNNSKIKKTIEKTKQDFNYIAGKSVKVKWDTTKTVTINYCGFNSLLLDKAISPALNQWTKELSDKLKIKLNYISNNQYPPFSDLNTNCIYVIDSYLTSPEVKTKFNPASTISSYNRHTGELFNSQILFWKKEFSKSNPHTNLYSTETQDLVYQTALHEFGHLFGLHHKGGDASIMGYNNINTLQPYDKLAINALYK